MKVSLMLVAGTAIGLMSMQALAQQERQPSQTPPTDSRPTDPNSKDTTTRKPLDTRDSRDTRATGSVANVLSDLEGTWRVSIQVNPAFFHEMGGHGNGNADWKTGDSPTYDNKSGTNPDRDQQKKDYSPTKNPANPSSTYPGSGSNNSNTPKNTNPKTVTSNPGTATTPSSTRSTDMSSTKTCEGYAVSELIMGGKVLRQSFVSNDMGANSMGYDASRDHARPDANKPENRTDGETNVKGDAKPDRAEHANRGSMNLEEGAFRGLSFFSFDPSDSTYQAVFMDSKSGEICTRSGTYDASSRRIVFEGSGKDASGARDNKAGMNLGDTHVVVEILSNDQHRVTMYKGSADSRTSTAGYNTPGSINTPGNTPGTPNTPNNTNNTNTPKTPGSPARTDGGTPGNTNTTPGTTTSTPALAMNDNVIYTATYTRATSADRTKINNLLHDDDLMYPSRRAAGDGRDVNDR